MTTEKQKSTAVLCYLCAAFFALLVGKEFFSRESTQFFQILSAVMFFGFSFVGTGVLCRTCKTATGRRRTVRIAVWVMTVVYLFFLVWFTLTDDGFGRHVHFFHSAQRADFFIYAKGHLNLVPFATVRLFLNGYQSGAVSKLSMVVNLIGNLLILTPTAIFLPVIFRSARRFSRFFLMVSVIVLGIEFMQLLLQTGSADIDDYLLNVLGASIAFILGKRILFPNKSERGNEP